MFAITQNEFDELVGYIKTHYGINLFQKKALIEGRLGNYLAEKGFENFQEYLDTIFSDVTGGEMTQLVSKLTTNHTFFLRESQHFDFLVKEVLPVIERNSGEKDVRIWSAGCSSGEEPYTIAMVLADYFKERKQFWDTKILATDISVNVLEKAISGVYPQEETENLPNLWKLNYFSKVDPHHVTLQDKIKNDVIFRVFNLMQAQFPFKRKFHVIFCRNVMIYFDTPTKAALFQKFYDHTESGGYLFIGHSESIGKENPGYKYIMPAIYRKG